MQACQAKDASSPPTVQRKSNKQVLQVLQVECNPVWNHSSSAASADSVFVGSTVVPPGSHPDAPVNDAGPEAWSAHPIQG